MKTTLFAILIISLFLISGCGPKDYCSTLDKRFSCTGKLDDSGSSITFTKVPQGKYTIGRITIEKNSEESESKRNDCGTMGANIIEKDFELGLTCKAKEPGRYTVHMKMYHQEPGSYNPASGETCLKKNNRWECDSSAFFAVTIR